MLLNTRFSWTKFEEISARVGKLELRLQNGNLSKEGEVELKRLKTKLKEFKEVPPQQNKNNQSFVMRKKVVMVH